MSSTGLCDLLIDVARAYCGVVGVDGPMQVAVAGGKIAALAESLNVSARQTIQCPDGVLLPGLIDLHGHPARSGSVFGVDPDRHVLSKGVTTIASQGDAGADNCDAYFAETIAGSRVNVLLAINLSRIGESTSAGCLANLDDADVDRCLAAIQRQRESIWAIAVNASHHCCQGSDPREVLRRGLLVAEMSGLPLFYGMRRPEDWPLAEQLALLRAGDVVTYCFRSRPHCIVAAGEVLPEVLDARARGVLFDVGHGGASFDFDTAEAAVAAGFFPDSISTDIQAFHLQNGVPHDLPLVMSKMLAVGMPEGEIFKAVGPAPAQMLGRADSLGALRVGAAADLVLLQTDKPTELVDCFGQVRLGNRWRASLVVRAGEICGGGKS